MAANVDAALGRRDDPGEGLEEGALARSIGPDDGQRFAMDEPECHLTQGPEGALALPSADDRRQGLAEGVLLRQPEVVANAELPNVDGVFGRRRGHQRTLANAGSSRLKSRVA